jgi:rod shape-determining protein MreC
MRRDQNLAIIGAVVTGAVIATGLVLLLVARVNPQAGAGVRAAAVDVLTPLWSLVRAPFDGLGRGADVITDYFGAVSRADRLEAEVRRLRLRLQVAEADQIAFRQLSRLGKLEDPQRRLLATARIVSATQGAVVRTALVAAGRNQGVHAGQPVIAADGLIGRTVETGAGSSRVLLLTDPQSRVPVLVRRTGEAALLSGDGGPTLLLTDRLGAQEPLQRGDQLLTSGEGGIFPPGVPVGIVVDVAEPVRVRPAASPLGAGFVRIEAAYAGLPAAETMLPVTDATVPVEAQQVGGIKGAVRGVDVPAVDGIR